MMNRPRACIVGLWALATIFLVLAATPAHACQTPVFRYALERWRADPYHILIVHRGALSDDERGLIARLDKAVEDPARMVNLFIDVVDLDNDPPAPAAKLAAAYADKPLPLIIVRYPPTARVPFDVAWAQPLSEAAVTALIDSPARRQIAKRILAGDSGVWVLLECGDKSKDDAAAALLEDELKKVKEQIKLPPVDPNTAVEDFRGDIKVELKVAFSVLRLKRDDPAEAFLVSALLGSEKDLTELTKTEPMTFTFFGRGLLVPGEGVEPGRGHGHGGAVGRFDHWPGGGGQTAAGADGAVGAGAAGGSDGRDDRFADGAAERPGRARRTSEPPAAVGNAGAGDARDRPDSNPVRAGRRAHDAHRCRGRQRRSRRPDAKPAHCAGCGLVDHPRSDCRDETQGGRGGKTNRRAGAGP